MLGRTLYAETITHYFSATWQTSKLINNTHDWPTPKSVATLAVDEYSSTYYTQSYG